VGSPRVNRVSIRASLEWMKWGFVVVRSLLLVLFFIEVLNMEILNSAIAGAGMPAKAAKKSTKMADEVVSPNTISSNSMKSIAQTSSDGAINISGQRNLSMGLLLQKKKDSVTFGTARETYRDKLSLKSENF
jgi:hypothetical protein